MTTATKHKTILGISFFRGDATGAVEAGLRGGLVVVPSAPVLVGIERDPALREAVLGADLALPDSGLMVLLWRLLTGEKIERVSGLEYLKLLLQILKPETVPLLAAPRQALGRELVESTANPVSVPAVAGQRNLKPELSQQSQVSGLKSQVSSAAGVLWIMPSAAARDRNLAWLQSQGHSTTVEDCYLAPVYTVVGELSDSRLLELIKERRPAHVILCIGGGTQERLGFYLWKNLTKPETGDLRPEGSAKNSGFRSQVSGFTGPLRPGIHCIGAAIGFLSGEQVNIPAWADYFYLGWLFRSLSEPGKFVPRYWRARRLIPLMWKYRGKAPVGKKPET